MSIDAMKQALEALELWEENLGNYKNHEWPISIRDGVITITFIPPVRKVGGGRRIELQSAERVELSQKHKFAKESLRAAIKEAEKQEPVAWMHPSWIDPDTRGWESDSFNAIPIEGWVPVYTAPKEPETQAEKLLKRIPVRGTLLEQTLGKVWDEMPHPDYQKETEQEPMAWFTVNEINEWVAKYLEKHPDQEPRQWQGLTDEEIVGASCECVDDGSFNMNCAVDFARAIEAKLKEKNNG